MVDSVEKAKALNNKLAYLEGYMRGQKHVQNGRKIVPKVRVFFRCVKVERAEDMDDAFFLNALTRVLAFPICEEGLQTGASLHYVWDVISENRYENLFLLCQYSFAKDALAIWGGPQKILDFLLLMWQKAEGNREKINEIKSLHVLAIINEPRAERSHHLFKRFKKYFPELKDDLEKMIREVDPHYLQFWNSDDVLREIAHQ